MHRFIVAVLALVIARPIVADPVCGTDEILDLTTVPILPFGGEIIGAGTLEGTIVNVRVDATFTATGSFDAADIGIALIMPIDGGSGSVGFTGAGLGWSGQGTFTASFDSSALDGDVVIPTGQGFYTWLVIVSNGNPANGAITGQFDDLRFTLEFGRCPDGDLDHDLAVGVTDLLLLLAAWGDPGCAGARPCEADIDGDGAVGVIDLLALLASWGDHFCPGCS